VVGNSRYQKTGGEVEGPGLPGCLAVAEITIAPRSRDRLVAIKCGRCSPALADHSIDGRRDTYQLRRSASDRGSEQHRDMRDCDSATS